jgi:(p)ppGpp synthase/HD superfamily hydrolase
MDDSVVPNSLLQTMPLHAITELYGTMGLQRRFDMEVDARFGLVDAVQLNTAFELARHLHEDDRRVREPYINHLLRVASRMLIYYHVSDVDVISAGLLHDSIEDHADEMAGSEPGNTRVTAMQKLAGWITGRTAQIVSGVTNPEFDPSGDKNALYLEHLEALVAAEDPWPIVVKLSDFTDNATGLIYTTGPKVPKLAKKYVPIVPVLQRGLARADLPLEPAVVSYIHEQLVLTKERLQLLAA